MIPSTLSDLDTSHPLISDCRRQTAPTDPEDQDGAEPTVRKSEGKL